VHLQHTNDDELLALSRKGWDSAFAVLVHRHAPRLLHSASHQPDPVAVVVEAFSGAMRAIDTPVDDVDAWLDSQLASVMPGEMPGEMPGDGQPSPTTDGAPPDAATIDTIWSQLRQRWPHGRRRRIPSHAVSIAATIVVTVAISAAIPWFVLGGYGDQPTIQDLRAFIVESRDAPAESVDIDEADEPEEQPLPTFEFPVPPEDREPPPAPDTNNGAPESTTDEEVDDADSPDSPDDTDSADDADVDDADSDGDGEDDAESTPRTPRRRHSDRICMTTAFPDDAAVRKLAATNAIDATADKRDAADALDPGQYGVGDMDPAALTQHGYAVVDWIAQYLATVEGQPVLSRVKPGEIAAQLPSQPPAAPEPFDAVLARHRRHAAARHHPLEPSRRFTPTSRSPVRDQAFSPKRSLLRSTSTACCGAPRQPRQNWKKSLSTGSWHVGSACGPAWHAQRFSFHFDTGRTCCSPRSNRS
jgi:hypothetical protein